LRQLLLYNPAQIISLQEVKMNTLIIEHVSVSELTKAWLAQLDLPITNRVTVRIEEESLAANNP
jgi:hypothetical protein